MTRTNNVHKDAVERVKIKLETTKAFTNVYLEKELSGVDLYATDKNEKKYFFTVIKGTKQSSRSVYSAVSAKTWEFVSNKHTKDLFFISEIEKEGQLPSYYVYTPAEMWHRSNNPYVQLKCNPLKDADLLIEFKDTIDVTPPASRYKEEENMLEGLQNLPPLLEKLKQIKKNLPAE